jgi:hypothetical protein
VSARSFGTGPVISIRKEAAGGIFLGAFAQGLV